MDVEALGMWSTTGFTRYNGRRGREMLLLQVVRRTASFCSTRLAAVSTLTTCLCDNTRCTLLSRMHSMRLRTWRQSLIRSARGAASSENIRKHLCISVVFAVTGFRRPTVRVETSHAVRDDWPAANQSTSCCRIRSSDCCLYSAQFAVGAER